MRKKVIKDCILFIQTQAHLKQEFGWKGIDKCRENQQHPEEPLNLPGCSIQVKETYSVHREL